MGLRRQTRPKLVPQGSEQSEPQFAPAVQQSALDKVFEKAVAAGYRAEDRAVWEKDRFRAQRDLFWLATELLGYDLVDNFYCPDDLTWSESEGICPKCKEAFVRYPGGLSDTLPFSPHRQFCDFFLKKNPDISISGQSEIKNRLMMAPRGSFKSSTDEADCVQWIICFPDVRIILQTAAEDLGTAFVGKVKGFFTAALDPKDKKKTKLIYTRFQMLFPEHVISPKRKGEEGEFTSPARSESFRGKEPSIFALSLKKNTSGWHFDVGKYDDCVSNANSGPSANEDSRDRVRQHIDLARSLVVPYGYHDNIGTPYDEKDAYAQQIEKALPDEFVIFKKPAWALKPMSRDKKESELREEDYDLFFPFSRRGVPFLTYRFLRSKQHADIHIFHCQYLVNPTSLKVAKFTDYLLRSHITGAEGLPQVYDCIVQWDLAYSVEDKRDYSVGGVGWFDLSTARLFLVNLVRGRFGKTELAFQIANQAYKWKASKIAIENSGGAQFLENDIRRELIRLGYPDCPIDWVKIDTNKNAKNSRAEGVETLLVKDRLWFSSEIDLMDEIVHEFTRFKPHSKRKDDIVDTIGHLAKYLPAAPEVPQSEQQRRQHLWDILAQKDEHERIFNVPEPMIINAPPPTELDVGYGPCPIVCMGCGMPTSSCFCR